MNRLELEEHITEMEQRTLYHFSEVEDIEAMEDNWGEEIGLEHMSTKVLVCPLCGQAFTVYQETNNACIYCGYSN